MAKKKEHTEKVSALCEPRLMRIHTNSGEPKTPRNFMSVCSLFSPCGTVTCACLIQVGSPASPQNSLRSFRGAPQARRDKHTPAPQANEKEKSKAERSRNHPLSRLGVRPRARSAAFWIDFVFGRLLERRRVRSSASVPQVTEAFSQDLQKILTFPLAIRVKIWYTILGSL